MMAISKTPVFGWLYLLRFHFQTRQPSDKCHYEVGKIFHRPCTFSWLLFSYITNVFAIVKQNLSIFYFSKSSPQNDYPCKSLLCKLHKANIKWNVITITIQDNNDNHEESQLIEQQNMTRYIMTHFGTESKKCYQKGQRIRMKN